MLVLPRPEEASGAIFPVGIEVMALYPQTTAFYPANISAPFVPGKVGAGAIVSVSRDDDIWFRLIYRIMYRNRSCGLGACLSPS